MYDQLKTRQVPINAYDYSALTQEFSARHQTITEKRGKTYFGNSLSGLRFEVLRPEKDEEPFKLTAHLNPRTYTFGHNYINASVLEITNFLVDVQKILPSDLSVNDLKFTSLEYGALIHQPSLFMWPLLRYYKGAPCRPMFPDKRRKNDQYGAEFIKGDTFIKVYNKQLQYEIERKKEIPPIENFEIKWTKVTNGSFPFSNFRLADINAPNVLEKLSNHILTTFNQMKIELNEIDGRNEPPKIKEYVSAYLRYGDDYMNDLGKDKQAEVRRHLKRLSQNSISLPDNRIKIEEALKPYLTAYSK